MKKINKTNLKRNNLIMDRDKKIINYKKNKKDKLIINEKIKNKILLLPKDIQKKIYIICFKIFWRNYVPLTAKVPSWYNHKIMIEKIIFDAKVKNIHFLHLPFNTLESNKKYIMGCQCNFCKNFFNNNDMFDEYDKLIDDPYYFKSIMPKSGEGINNYFHVYGDCLLKNYDPYCGSEYEDYISYSLRTGKKINFELD